jgi:hypothetical protein
LTLQQLLQETCDEATLANNEISRLTDENERGRHEVATLKETLVSLLIFAVCSVYILFNYTSLQDSNKSLESILGLKTLARNVKKITGVNSNSQENLDDNMRKVPTTPSSKYVNHHPQTHTLIRFIEVSFAINLTRYRLRKMRTH